MPSASSRAPLTGPGGVGLFRGLFAGGGSGLPAAARLDQPSTR